MSPVPSGGAVSVRLETCPPMRRQLLNPLLEIMTPFARGARLGAYVAGATLALSVLGAVVVLATQPVPDAHATVASDARTIPPERGERTVRAKIAVEIDPALLEASRRWQADHATPLELSRAASSETPPASTPAADAAAPAATTAPTIIPVPAPVILADEALREAVASYFPDQVDYALAIVMCESAGNARAVSPSGYYGLWQFDLGTWASVGGVGYPSDASVDEQMMRARMLYDARGWSPWGCA